MYGIILVAVIAIIAGLLLSWASIQFAVPVDEKQAAVREVLPGANCGACGFSGCDGYAAALAAGTAEIGLCSPGGPDVAEECATILGKAAGEMVRKVALVQCNGTCSNAGQKLIYDGVDTCQAVSLMFAGDSTCAYGCLGHGDCAAVCPEKAILVHDGLAMIDQDKCVSCGMCLVSCPFSAIVDKSQIFQTVLALKSDTPIYAAIAPSFVKQFGDKVTPEQVRAALKAVGFEDMVEVAIGADLCAVQEAADFMKEVPNEHPWLGTSCCPAWSVMAKKTYPEYADCISMALTPMVLTGRMTKKQHPDCKVVFIGPCAAKKLEASRKSVRSDIDFVLTFEEMMGIFDAKNIEFDKLEVEEPLNTSSSLGKGFAASGGVAAAVVNAINCLEPEREVKTVKAEGLKECKTMLAKAKAGMYDGYLLEGMACPGGCMGGAGVLADVRKATMGLEQQKKTSTFEKPSRSDYLKYLHLITKEDFYNNENEN